MSAAMGAETDVASAAAEDKRCVTVMFWSCTVKEASRFIEIAKISISNVRKPSSLKVVIRHAMGAEEEFETNEKSSEATIPCHTYVRYSVAASLIDSYRCRFVRLMDPGAKIEAEARVEIQVVRLEKKDNTEQEETVPLMIPISVVEDKHEVTFSLGEHMHLAINV